MLRTVADETPSPVVDAQLVCMPDLVVGGPVVKGLGRQIADVTEAVPLAAFLGIVIAQYIIVAEQSKALEALLDVAHRFAPE